MTVETEAPLASESSVPAFAVVGRVNRGKSSVIATLAEEDSIAISPIPGTTRTCAHYDVEHDGRVLFRLIDTPGFEEAARALAWLTCPGLTADRRRARLLAFVDEFEGSDAFAEERALLQPILEGAAVLYVVDGSTPFRENIMSEVEILRWTGRPRMALINRSAPPQGSAQAALHAERLEQWRAALEPAFSVVRNFDAHAASFEQRLSLLTLFRELVEEWQQPLGEALSVLRADYESRLALSVDAIVELLARAVSHTLLVRAPRSAGLRSADRARAAERFVGELRALEEAERREVEALYRHHRLQRGQESELQQPLFDRDLFSERVWSLLGLSWTQLVALYSLAGATAGGALDVAVGGASFFVGSVAGAAAGGALALVQLGQRAISMDPTSTLSQRLLGAEKGLVEYRVGPHRHPNFPFVVLDRAVLHHQAVRYRAHALNGQVALSLPEHPGQGPSHSLGLPQRRRLAAAFKALGNNADHAKSRQALHEVVAQLLSTSGPAPRVETTAE